MADQTFTLGVDLETKGAASGLKDLQKELEKTANSAKGVGKGFGESLKSFDSGIKDTISNLRGLSGSGGIAGVSESVIRLTSGLGLAAGALVAVGAASVGATIALITNASAMAAAADDAAELADNLGVTTTELAALQLVASESGTSAQSLVATYDKLGKSLNEVQDGSLQTENSFRRLGIQQSDLAGKSREQIAGIVIKNFEALGRTVQATAAAQDLLGRSFRENITAIKAAGDGLDEYKKIVTETGAVASAELVAAGGRQERAISKLRLEFDGLRNDLATGWTEIVTGAAEWATGVIKEIKRVKDAIRDLNPQGKIKDLFEARLITQAEIDAAQAKSYEGVDRGGPDPVTAISQGIKNDTAALERQYKILKDIADVRAAENAAETRRLGGKGSAGRPVTPLPDKPKPVVAERLTEAQRDIQRFRDTMLSSFSDLDKQIAVSAQGTDTIGISITTLAFKLYDAGKGVVSFADALKIAQTQQSKFAELQATKVKESIDQTLASMSKEVEYLKLGNKEREVRLALDRAASSAGYKSTAAFEAANPTAAGEVRSMATAKYLTGVDVAGEKQIESLREQSALLSIVDEKERTRIQTQQDLYRAIDPDGKGENITRAQKAEIDAISATIEKQKELIEINRKISDSFAGLGDAVTRNMLRMTDSSKQLKLELVKLLALTAMRYYAGQGSSLGTAFFGGLAGTRAAGGPVDANKDYLVGEKGPEVVRFKQSGMVIPNHQISAPRSRQTSITVAPSLIIQGSITGQSELDRAFEEFAGAMADQMQGALVAQGGSNGIYRSR